MPKANKKQQDRDAIQLTIQCQEFAKVLFPDLVNDEDAMEVAEGEIYDLLNDNPDASEEEIMADIRTAIEATRTVGKSVTPDHVFLMFDRMMRKEMF